MWWSKRRRENVSALEVISRIREFFLDSQVPSAHHMSVLMGCIPISDDVAEHEEEDSEDRVEKIDHLIPILHAFASTMAQATVSHQKAHLEDDSEGGEFDALLKHLPEGVWEAAETVLTQVGLTTLIGTLSQLVDMEFLVVGTRPKFKRKFRK